MRTTILGLGSLLALLLACAPSPAATERATFAGGCFWCVESAFEGLPGVISVTSGFSGGQEENPTYERVSSGTTGHAEAVQIVYDPTRTGYGRLLEVFWHNVDPLSKGGQFCDRGNQYRSAVFFHDEKQRIAAEESKKLLEASGRFDGPIVTEIAPFGAFYPAEEYHQDFYKKDPGRYRSYRLGCGRDLRLKQLWGEEAGGAHSPTRPSEP